MNNRNYAGFLLPLLAAMPIAQNAAAQDFPGYDELVAANVALSLEGFMYPGGLIQDAEGNPTCDGTQPIAIQWAGSGVIIDPDGTLFTNWHVAGKAVRARATFDSGATYDVRFIKAYNQYNDLATLQIAANQAFSPAALGDSDTARPLDRVLAVGNPRATGLNVTEGAISQVKKDEYGVPEIVRHTAPIASGNSGGALYRGKEVIAINVATWTGTQFHQAVPINIAKRLLQFKDPVLLSDAFSTERPFEEGGTVHVDTVSGELEVDGNAGVIHMLDGLTDYIFLAQTVEDADVDLLITDGQGNLFGCAASRTPGIEALVRTNDYPQEVRISLYNSSNRAIPVQLDIFKVKW